MNDIKNYTETIFDSIKHIDDDGYEYWEARELMPLLGYKKWQNFSKVIDNAKIICDFSKIDEQFTEVSKLLIGGHGNKQKVKDYKLSRHTCYLIALAGDGTISLGDEVKFGDEVFYVISNDNIDTKLLPKYNLNSDSIQDPTGKFKLAYSNTSYWSDGDYLIPDIYNHDSYDYAYIYRTKDNEDTPNNYKKYINNYKTYLKYTLGISDISDVRLMSYEEATLTGCRYYRDNTCPDYVSNQSYNIGSTYNDDYCGGMIWSIRSYEKYLSMQDDGGLFTYDMGIRPIVIIPTSSLTD